MERVLGILGSAILLSLLSVTMLIVENVDSQRSPNLSSPAPSQTSYDELNDTEKLQRLEEDVEGLASTTLINRAMAYEDTAFCDAIDEASLAEKCREQVREATGQVSGESSDETVTREDRRTFNRALAYQNESRCEEIGADSLQERCKNSLS